MQPALHRGVIAGRVLLLLLAAAALAGGVAISKSGDRASAEGAARFVCPMHPQVTSATPGDCPICNMALERVQEGKNEAIVATRPAVAEVKRQVIAQVVRAPAWVQRGGVVTAVFHRESLEGFGPGETAVFFSNAEPALAVTVHRTTDPVVPWDSATVRVRLAAEKTPGREGATGWVQIEARARQLLVVPESAVLYSGQGAYVLAAPAGGDRFSRRSIQVGRILDSGYVANRAAERLGGVVVLAGLREGDRVVAADTFVLDAERRLHAAQGHPEEIVE